MEFKTALRNKLNVLILFAALCVNLVFAASFNNADVGGNKHVEGTVIKNAKGSMKGGNVKSAIHLDDRAISNSRKEATIPSPPYSFETSQRNKRNALDKFSGNSNLRHLFPTNIDDLALQKWLVLLTAKPRDSNWAEDYEEEDFDDDTPAIDLLYGRKPGSMKSSSMDGNKLGAWAGDEPTAAPIVLHQHRMSKKANSMVGLPPEVVLRETAAASARAQPEPHIMRKLLARMIFRAPRSDSDNNGVFYSLNQLLEHSSRKNKDAPSVARLIL